MSELLDQREEKAMEQNTDLSPAEGTTESTPAKKKISAKTVLIFSGAILAIIVLIVILSAPSHFEKVKNHAVEIAGAGQITHWGDDNDNFTIDTYPYEDCALSPSAIAMLAADTERDALEAIRYVNRELGFNGALYDQMLETYALMGRQSEENSKYKVTWTYHPDKGLEVTYQTK